jgi:hypothetical protein
MLAGWVGYWTTTLLTLVPSAFRTHAPALSSPSSHSRLDGYVSIWSDSPSVAITGPIFKRRELKHLQ